MNTAASIRCPICRASAAASLLPDETSSLLIEALTNATGHYVDVVGESDPGLAVLHALLAGLIEGQAVALSSKAGES